MEGWCTFRWHPGHGSKRISWQWWQKSWRMTRRRQRSCSCGRTCTNMLLLILRTQCRESRWLLERLAAVHSGTRWTTNLVSVSRQIQPCCLLVTNFLAQRQGLTVSLGCMWDEGRLFGRHDTRCKQHDKSCGQFRYARRVNLIGGKVIKHTGHRRKNWWLLLQCLANRWSCDSWSARKANWFTQ